MPRSFRLLLALSLLLTCLLHFARPVAAEGIAVQSAELRLEDDAYVLNAEFDFALNPTLEEALGKGVPLYFILEAEIDRVRWYWRDQRVARLEIQYRLTYDALTRQYRIGTGLLSQHLNTLEEVERVLSRVAARPVARKDELVPGTRYGVAVRLRLDVGQLPKPFQLTALASRDWSLQSEWHRWSFTP